MYKQQLLEAIKCLDLRKDSYFTLEGEPFPSIVKKYLKLLPKDFDVFIRLDDAGDVALVIEHENGYAVFRRYRP